MPEPRNTSEEDRWAADASAGDAEAFAQLATRFCPRLIQLLAGRLGSRHDAEDLAQQTLLRAWSAIDRYDPARPVAPWLMTIALRLARDHLRARRRKPPGRPLGHADAHADPTPGPPHAALADEQASTLWACAARALPPRQWTALWLAYGEGMTGSEVAHAMAVSPVHARVLLHRAKTTLRKRWRPESPAIAEAQAHAPEHAGDLPAPSAVA